MRNGHHKQQVNKNKTSLIGSKYLGGDGPHALRELEPILVDLLDGHRTLRTTRTETRTNTETSEQAIKLLLLPPLQKYELTIPIFSVTGRPERNPACPQKMVPIDVTSTPPHTHTHTHTPPHPFIPTHTRNANANANANATRIFNQRKTDGP